MPATRSGRFNAKGKGSSVRSLPVVPDDEVIIISSDDEAPDSTTVALHRAREEVRKLKKQLFSKEPSSSQVLMEQGNYGHSPVRSKNLPDEEQKCLKTSLQQTSADINKLRSALRREKEMRVRDSLQLQKLKKRAQAAEMEIVNLTTLNKDLLERASKNKGTKCLNELEDHILCEICQDKLWQPCTLIECGHTLCQGCLTDWFNTALVANPYQPSYECPKCRTRVYHKPIEDFTLKGIVRAISHAMDPTNGSPHAPSHARTGHGPWFRFFGQ